MGSGAVKMPTFYKGIFFKYYRLFEDDSILLLDEPERIFEELNDLNKLSAEIY